MVAIYPRKSAPSRCVKRRNADFRGWSGKKATKGLSRGEEESTIGKMIVDLAERERSTQIETLAKG